MVDPVTNILANQIKHESYVRALSDDFSVVDEVATTEDYNRIYKKETEDNG